MDKLIRQTFEGKRVLVTGHTGFKGSWLSLWLHSLGAEVIGYALDPVSERDNFLQSGIGSKIVDLRGDIRDYKGLKALLFKYKPEIIFHLAAQPLVRHSYLEPRYTYEVNVMGTINLLEAVRECEETRAAVIITSDKCYENREWVWGYRENDPMGGYDPYSSSKGCVELLVSSWRQSYFNPEAYEKHRKVIATVRAGNVIGGGDWAKDRIVPDCINCLRESRDIIVRNPASVRPWQHVLEPLSGYLLLCAKIFEEGPRYSGAWNFGPEADSMITVGEIAELIVKHWGSGKWTQPSEAGAVPHEAKLLSLDISKARQLLGWKPRWRVDKAIEKTVEWYKKYENVPAYDMCMGQIKEYLGSAQCTVHNSQLEVQGSIPDFRE